MSLLIDYVNWLSATFGQGLTLYLLVLTVGLAPVLLRLLIEGVLALIGLAIQGLAAGLFWLLLWLAKLLLVWPARALARRLGFGATPQARADHRQDGPPFDPEWLEEFLKASAESQRRKAEHDRHRRQEHQRQKERQRRQEWQARQRSENRQQKQTPPRGGADRYQEAVRLLELTDGFGRDDLKRRYRQLMIKVHPDAGGSTVLAQRVNEAAALIKQRRGWA